MGAERAKAHPCHQVHVEMFHKGETVRVFRNATKVFSCAFPEHASGAPNVENRAATTRNTVDHIARFYSNSSFYCKLITVTARDSGVLLSHTT